MIPSAAGSAPPPRSAICPADWTGGPSASPGESEQPVEPEVVHVVPGSAAVGAILAIAGDRAVDQTGVDLPQLLITDAQALHHAGAKRLEQDVGLGGEAFEDIPAGIGLEVEPDRTFAAVEREKER